MMAASQSMSEIEAIIFVGLLINTAESFRPISSTQT